MSIIRHVHIGAISSFPLQFIVFRPQTQNPSGSRQSHQTTQYCVYSGRWPWLQRCPLAQPNHAGKKKGPRQVSLLKKVLITPLIWVLQAPTMASLAKQGVILEQNYVQPKCAPSRAALMTGETWQTLQASSSRESGRSLLVADLVGLLSWHVINGICQT